MGMINNKTGITQVGQFTPTPVKSTPGTSPTAPAAPGTPRPQDQVQQLAGGKGQAGTVSFVDGSALNQQLRSRLASKDFDAVAQMVEGLSPRQLAALELTSAELTALADGLGRTSWVPGSYGAADQSVMQRLIQHSSSLNVNQKVALLQSLVSPGALLEFVQTARTNTLQGLSSANRQLLLSSLDPGSSLWGDVQGAATEAISRRYFGGGQRTEDALASKVLRSARNEQELKTLLSQISQFNRDDVAARYIMDLPPAELAKLSEGTRKELLQTLVDTSINVAGLNIDFNNLGNLDEVLGMTFKEHIAAAKRVYLSLAPATQASAEVQQVVGRSDELLAELGQLEHKIQDSVKNKNLTSADVTRYTQQLDTIRKAYPNRADVQQKVAALLDTMRTFQAQSTGLAQSGQALVNDLNTAQQQLKTASTSLARAKSETERLQTVVSRADTTVKKQQTTLIEQHRKLAEMRTSLTGMTEDYQRVLSDLQAALTDQKPASDKLARLTRFNDQLKQMEAKAVASGQLSAQALLTLDTTAQSLDAEMEQYNQTVATFNSDRDKLKASQQGLQTALTRFQGKLQTLEQTWQKASGQLKDLEATPGVQAADLQPLRQELQEGQQDLQQHRATAQTVATALEQKILPQATQLLQAADVQATQIEKLQAQVASIGAAIVATLPLGEEVVAAAQFVANTLTDLLGKARDQITRWKQEMPKVDPASVAALNAEMETMKANLIAEAQKNNASPAEIAAELKEIEAMQAELTGLQQQYGQLTSASESLGGSLQGLQQEQQLAESELKAAGETLKSAEQALKNTQAKVDGLMSTVATLEKSLTQHNQALTHAEEALQREQALSATAKQNYQAGGTDQLLTQLRQSEQRQQALRNEINGLRQQVTQAEQTLKTHYQSLNGSQAVLSQQSQALTTASAKVQQQQTKLQTVYDRVLKELDASQGRLQQWQQQNPTNPAVQQKLQEIASAQGQVSQAMRSSQALVAQASERVAATLPLQRQIEAATQALQQAEASWQQTSQNLHATGASLSGLEQQFASIDDRIGQMRVAADQLENALRTGEQAQDAHVLLQQIDAMIMAPGTDSQAVAKLQSIRTRVETYLRVKQDSQALLTSHQALRTRHASQIAAAQQEVGALRAHIQTLKGQLPAMEAEVASAKDSLLSSQRELLAERRNLGISSADYQQALAQASALLESGKPLTEQEVKQLEQLETVMAQTEARLVNTSSALRGRIEQMNARKAEINQQIGVLNQRIQNLTQLRAQLVSTQTELKAALPALQTSQQALTLQRQELATALTDAEALLREFPGLQGVAELVRSLKSELQEVDTLLAAFGDEITKTETQITEADQLISVIDVTLQEALAIRQHLVMLVGQIEDVIEAAEALLNEVQGLLSEAQKQRAQAGEALETAQQLQPTASADTGKGPAGPQSLGEKAFHSFRNLLQSAPTPVRTHNSAQSEADRETKQKQALAEFRARIAQSVQQSETLRENIAAQAELEAFTERLVQQAYQGMANTSGANIVGLTEIAQRGNDTLKA
jgi:chromosome segregation ATPase